MTDAVLLFSGGLDSAALAYMLRPSLLLTVDYGQRGAPGELASSKAITSDLRLRHEIATVRPALGTGGMLSDEPLLEDVPTEWWPYRNQLLFTLGATLAVSCGLPAVILGTVAEDAHYADGRPEFVAAANSLLKIQEHPVRLDVPAIAFTSAELLRKSGLPASIASRTHACSRSPLACGVCASCAKARDVFAELYL